MVELRAVLWDFGGVILSSPFEAFAAYEARRGLPAGFLRSVNATNPHDNAWAHLERADIGLDEFAARFEDESAALGHAVSGRDVLGLLFGEPRPQMVEALRRCGDRFATALLTNNFLLGDGPGPLQEAMAPILELFDVVVESSVVGVRKPDPRFYELALDQLGITAPEAVFLDDLGVNLKPARAMGMRTIKVVDPDDALDELEAIVGFPLR